MGVKKRRRGKGKQHFPPAGSEKEKCELKIDDERMKRINDNR